MKKYEVWIYDRESGCDQPITVSAKNEAEARAAGNRYIRSWRLAEGTITRIKEVE